MAALDPSHDEQVSEDIGSFALELKHKVFLSHSGAQKSFVELLTAELEARHCSPFFDKRSDCLPVGRNFSSLILKAAKQCHVAVVVLSEAYFSSKWLMMELVAFHEAQQEGNPQLKILPLFFKLSVKDLDEPSIEHRWMPKWREHANTPTSGIDLNKWSAAVKSLLRANGIVFNSIAKSEASYGSVVTEAILKLSPPDLPYGTSRSVVGCGRLCEILSTHFAEDKKTGTLRLGLYGMGGIGKTTLCKDLCHHFQKDFSGRVCHVDFGEPSDAVLRQKQVLGELCSIRDEELDRIKDTHTGWKLMQNRMKQEKVFLVIDNVTDGYSLGEAREYLKAGFPRESKIIITSRSRHIVEGLLFESKLRKLRMPYITGEVGTVNFLKMECTDWIIKELMRKAIEDTKLDATAQLMDDEAQPSENDTTRYVVDSYAPGLKNLNLPESRCRVDSDDGDGEKDGGEEDGGEEDDGEEDDGRAPSRGLMSRQPLFLSGCGLKSLGNMEPLPKWIRCSSLPELPLALAGVAGFHSYTCREVCRKTLNWKAEEICAVLKLAAEASTVDVGPDPWEYVSGSLLKQYNFDRDSSSCERLWGTLLQRYWAIRHHESKVIIGKLSFVSYWEMDEEQRSCKNLPRAFDLEWYKMINSILAAKRSFEEGKSFPGSAMPFCQFQSSGSDASHFGSADCDEEIYRDPSDSQSEELDSQSEELNEDDGLSGDSIATLESQADATAESHVNQARQNQQPGYETSSDNSARTRSVASSDEDLQEKLISRVAPFVNKQIEDALKPLIAILKGRKEDEQKHHEKLLAIESQKLALKCEKMQRFTLLGVPSNSCNSGMQFGRNFMLVDSLGNGAGPYGAQEAVALNVDASSHPKGITLNANFDVCNTYGAQAVHGDHSRLQTSPRSSANPWSPIRSPESTFSLDMSRIPFSFQSNACSQGFMAGTEENAVGSSDPASTLHQRLQGFPTENMDYKYRSKSSLGALMPEVANLGTMQTELFDESYPTAYHLQWLGKQNPLPSSQGGASFPTPAQRTYISGPTQLPTPPWSLAAVVHSFLGKRGVCDGGRLDDSQSPAKALRPNTYDSARKLQRDQADVHTNATLKPPKLESMGGACEESPDSLRGRRRLPCNYRKH